MTVSTPYPVWSDAQWQRQARDWIDGHLDRGGRRVNGPVEPRLRPWSLVWRVPTDGGPVWFKANGPATGYEAPLVAALARLVPGAVVAPIAVDPDRGWLLLPDGGPTLREATAPQRDAADPADARAGLARWERALTGYAELQLAAVGHVDELLALGVPDHRPEALPALLADLLDDRAALRGGADGGLTPETYQRLRAYQPDFAALCARLAGSGLPVTVQHDDLHDGNVFVDGGRDRFFDWGDASIGHPFGTLLVTLRSAAYTFGLEPGDPALVRLRDAYLEPWSARYDRRTLLAAVGPAVTVAKVGRSLAWRRALATDDPSRAEYADAVPGWLAEVFAPDPL
ncbi:phosphotransferase [Micromonospora rosaria]|uniref:Phosphotransferase n=1 Tax=Micromonospora rosaria TaxID=47874 RepID=A0A136PR59_9ACTN|nr:phosphotransferase [Micromonospora rosaria]KXK60847.1 phosphotransferase [Micromonospora rosaria]